MSLIAMKHDICPTCTCADPLPTREAELLAEIERLRADSVDKADAWDAISVKNERNAAREAAVYATGLEAAESWIQPDLMDEWRLRVRALQPQPAPQATTLPATPDLPATAALTGAAVVITDEMVGRALAVWVKFRSGPTYPVMRAAITAALTPEPK